MKPSNASAIASSLSAHAEPFLPRGSTVAVPDGAAVSFPVLTSYSSPIQPQVSDAIFENYYYGRYYGSFDSAGDFVSEWLPTLVSASPSGFYSSPNTKPGPSPCSTLKKLEIAFDPTCQQSSDDIDSPCYKGRNWSPFPPRHMGETSAPPRVTVEKLEEEQNLSVPETPVGPLMVSDENANGPTLPVSVRPLEDSLRDVGSAGNTPTKQEFLPGSSRREMLQKIVDLSNMLLQIPSNYADLDEGDEISLKNILANLEKLLEKDKKKRDSGENEEN